jgi:hypothetical protein
VARKIGDLAKSADCGFPRFVLHSLQQERGVPALLGRLRLGAPAVGGDALPLLMERFQRDIAERIMRALGLTYVVDVCNVSDSDIAGLAMMDCHKMIRTSIRDEARETWAV